MPGHIVKTPVVIGKSYPVICRIPYPLPKGLSDGDRVKIVGQKAPRSVTCTAVAQDGREFELYITQIETGHIPPAEYKRLKRPNGWP